MEALQSNEFKKLINSNPQIKSVMQDGGNIQKAQNMLKDPEVAQTISKMMTNPETLQKAGAMLEGLKQVDAQVQGQLGGGRRRRRKSRRKSRKRRKSRSRRRRGGRCFGEICKLVLQAVTSGNPTPLYDRIKKNQEEPDMYGQPIGINNFTRGRVSYSLKTKLKQEFDRRARTWPKKWGQARTPTDKEIKNNRRAAFLEWWIFEKMKLDLVGKDDWGKLEYKKQFKFVSGMTLGGPAGEKMKDNDDIKEWWDFDKYPIPTEENVKAEKAGPLVKMVDVKPDAAAGGRRRKSRRKKKRKSKKRKSKKRKSRRRKRRN